jgi:phospholipid/cholesterol/gamma-HCH transport system substrate-binding protein
MADSRGKVLTPLKVGLLVVGAFVAFAAFLQIVSTRGFSRSGSYEVSALFDDVLGLEPRSPVQIAGIDVGRIQRITLDGGKARVTMEIDEGVELYQDASIEKVAISLLGDYKLAVEPGSPRSPRLGAGGEIKNVRSLSDMDAIVAEVKEMSQAMRKLVAGTATEPAPLQAIVEDVRGSATAARRVLEEVALNIEGNTDQLDAILGNIEAFSRDLSKISADKDREVQEIVKDLRAITGSVRNTSEQVERIIAGQNRDDLQESVKSLRQTLETMNRALENVASITAKMDQGAGTVGKLVNDESIHTNVAEAAEGINSVVGGLARLQTWVNLRSEFQFRAGAAKNYLQLSLRPSEDKQYIFEVVDDPRGRREVTIEDVESTSPELGRNFQYRERRTITNEDLTFSLMFAKRYYWLQLRFGIIESSGGLGANLYFLEDRFELLLDLNRFGEEARYPRFKALALLEIIPHVYLNGGIDDPFNSGTVDYFLGLGVRFNDEDLKRLIAIVGVPTGGR